MMIGIPMSKVKIAILETKIERLMEKQKELTERVRSNEKFIAGVGAVGTLAIAALGFIGSAEAEVTDKSFNAGQWIQDVRDWESEKNRTPIDETLNSALIMHEEESYGCDGSTESEELLQFPSGQDQPSGGWRHDRRDTGPRVQPDEERESENCRCGHPREEDERPRGEDPWDRRNELDEGQIESSN